MASDREAFLELNELWSKVFGIQPRWRYFESKSKRFKCGWNTEPVRPVDGKKWAAFVYKSTKGGMERIFIRYFKSRAAAKRCAQRKCDRYDRAYDRRHKSEADVVAE